MDSLNQFGKLKIGLYDSDGNYLPFWKKLLYGLIQSFLSFFTLFFSFYVGYGLNFFSYPFGVVGYFLVTPLLLIVISATLFFFNGIAMFLPIFSDEKITPIDYLLKIRYADLKEGK